jgi:adenylate cyclase
MFTDMVGYTALGQQNESLSLALVEEQRKLIRPVLERHGGREVKTIGDAFLVEFPNAVDAVRCAYDVQRAIREFNLSLASESRIHLRIGVHVGEVVESQGDISGDAVNVASRVEPLAEDGGVCISRQVYDHVRNKIDLPLVSLGLKDLKNVTNKVEVFKVVMPWEGVSLSKEASALPRDRMAILPFVSFSPDPNDTYFADGITDEIISTVAGISGLSVISRTSVMGYKGTTKKVGDIGRELGAGTILEGSFKKAGNRIRVTAQLIDAATDRHLWSQNYDRNLDDVFEVQSDIAKQISAVLSIKIPSPEIEQIEKKPTKNTTAYSLYLKGRYLWNKRQLEDLKNALGYFDEAVAEDPGFAPGYVGKADCHLLFRNNFMIDPKQNLEVASKMVKKALELDPELAEAHATKGMILNTEFELQEAEREFSKAIELKPSYATAHQWYFWMLRSEYRWKEALAEIEKAFELDPLSPVIIGNYSGCLFELSRAREALHHLELADKLEVLNASAYVWQSFLYSYFGRGLDAANCLEKASKIDPNDLEVLEAKGFLEYLKGNHWLAKEAWERGVTEGTKRSAEVRRFIADLVILYSETGERERALEGIAKLEAMPDDTKDEAAYKGELLAIAYAAVGDNGRFFQTYKRLVEGNLAFGGGLLRRMPVFLPRADDIYKDTRWSDLLRRVGMAPMGDDVDSQ